MFFKFEDIIAWQKAILLGKNVYDAFKNQRIMVLQIRFRELRFLFQIILQKVLKESQTMNLNNFYTFQRDLVVKYVR